MCLNHSQYLQRDGRQNTAEEGGHGAAGEEDRGGIPASFHREVLQWKSEVSQQLGFLQRQHSETSQRLAGLSGALRELQVKLVGTVQQETNQVCVCVCVLVLFVSMCALVYVCEYACDCVGGCLC